MRARKGQRKLWVCAPLKPCLVSRRTGNQTAGADLFVQIQRVVEDVHLLYRVGHGPIGLRCVKGSQPAQQLLEGLPKLCGVEDDILGKSPVLVGLVFVGSLVQEHVLRDRQCSWANTPFLSVVYVGEVGGSIASPAGIRA